MANAFEAFVAQATKDKPPSSKPPTYTRVVVGGVSFTLNRYELAQLSVLQGGIEYSRQNNIPLTKVKDYARHWVEGTLNFKMRERRKALVRALGL